jgi:hypothetical protein
MNASNRPETCCPSSLHLVHDSTKSVNKFYRYSFFLPNLIDFWCLLNDSLKLFLAKCMVCTSVIPIFLIQVI